MRIFTIFTMINASMIILAIAGCSKPSISEVNSTVAEPLPGQRPQAADTLHARNDDMCYDAIDELEQLSLNGCNQSVLYRGDHRSNPIVLFVHGGPGYPLMWYSRAMDDAFVKDFVVVHWDQRGAGKSYSKDTPIETITLAQIVEDGLALTEHLKKKFDTDKIVLAGHSWGTMVAANMAYKSPACFHAFVSVGTCADWKRGEELRYADLQALARQNEDCDAIDKLLALGPPPYRTAERTEQFGEIVYRLQGFSGVSRRMSEQDLADAIAKTTEYTADEIETTLAVLRQNLNLLSDFLNEYVLMKAIPELDVPVVFVHGEYDTNTPLTLGREYFELLDAPRGKSWIVFDDCAHMAMYEDQEQFLHVLKATLD